MEAVLTDVCISGPPERIIRFRKRCVDRLKRISEHNRHPQVTSIRGGSLGPGSPCSHGVSFVSWACLLLQACLAQILPTANFFGMTFDFNSENFCQFCKQMVLSMVQKSWMCIALYAKCFFYGIFTEELPLHHRCLQLHLVFNFGLSWFVLWTYLTECFACLIWKTTKDFFDTFEVVRHPVSNNGCFFFHQCKSWEPFIEEPSPLKKTWGLIWKLGHCPIFPVRTLRMWDQGDRRLNEKG